MFRQAVFIMKKAEHLTKDGLESIINLRASINRGLTPALKEAFPNHVPAIKTTIKSLCHWV